MKGLVTVRNCTKFLLFFFIILNPFLLFAAEIKGRVVDENGEGMPIVTLHLKNTTIGTTTNVRGYYSLEIPPGKHTIIFQFVGYKMEFREVEIEERDITLDVTMRPEVVELQEVVINANAEDPAYEIIRRAISKRKEYLNEVNAYKCDVYIKGMQTLEARPDKIFGINVTIDTGIVYLSESVSELSYERPDKIKERMISSKVSGSNTAFSYNMASEMMVNFYENLLYAEGLSERGFVSPIANNALMFYDYELIGTKFEHDRLINKIRVIPKRPNDPVGKGYIYILEGSWRIHSLELVLTKANGIEFVDSLTVSQFHAPVEEAGVWAMISQKFTFNLNILGFKGKGNFVGVHSNYDIQPTFDKRHFNREILSIAEDANKKSDLYWSEVRPIPLTRIEKRDYAYKDALREVTESKAYKDSIDRISNRFNPGNFLSGYRYSNSYARWDVRLNPIYDLLQYNTVEGAVLNLEVAYRKTAKDDTYWQVTPMLRYGFSNKRFNAQLGITRYFNRKKFSLFEVSGGRFVFQFNRHNPISPLINTFETLVLGNNYMKLYAKDYGKINYQTELVNGILFKGQLEYSQRSELENTASFALPKEENTDFTPNRPENVNVESTAFDKHQAFIMGLGLRFTFAQDYISRPNRKIIMGSKYPVIYLDYERGFKFLGSDINFDHLSARIRDDVKFGLVGTGSWSLSAGYFFNTDSLTFVDFQHFNGNRSIFAQFRTDNFQLLDYYLYSTTDEYFAAHYEHHFNGFIFNKIPFVRKFKLQTVASTHFLYTPGSNTYVEFGIGIEHIFKILRVDYYFSLLDGRSNRQGVRLGIGF